MQPDWYAVCIPWGHGSVISLLLSRRRQHVKTIHTHTHTHTHTNYKRSTQIILRTHTFVDGESSKRFDWLKPSLILQLFSRLDWLKYSEEELHWFNSTSSASSSKSKSFFFTRSSGVERTLSPICHWMHGFIAEDLARGDEFESILCMLCLPGNRTRSSSSRVSRLFSKN